MKTILRFILATLFILPGISAYAGSCTNCVIESIGTGPSFDRECPSSSCALVRINKESGSFMRDPCSTTLSWHFALDTSTASGKTTLSQLMTALNSGRPVVIGGDNKCTIYSSGTIEDLGHMYFYWAKEINRDFNSVYERW